jgi:hypothetical protein
MLGKVPRHRCGLCLGKQVHLFQRIGRHGDERFINVAWLHQDIEAEAAQQAAALG